MKSMSVHQIPFFLSSATNHGINSTNTSFVLHMNPPLEIPAKATAARAFIHSATVPYVMPNVISGKNTLYVRIPIKDADGDDVADGGRDVEITIPPGLYSLTGSETASLEDTINEATRRLTSKFWTMLIHQRVSANFCCRILPQKKQISVR